MRLHHNASFLSRTCGSSLTKVIKNLIQLLVDSEHASLELQHALLEALRTVLSIVRTRCASAADSLELTPDLVDALTELALHPAASQPPSLHRRYLLLVVSDAVAPLRRIWPSLEWSKSSSIVLHMLELMQHPDAACRGWYRLAEVAAGLMEEEPSGAVLHMVGEAAGAMAGPAAAPAAQRQARGPAATGGVCSRQPHGGCAVLPLPVPAAQRPAPARAAPASACCTAAGTSTCCTCQCLLHSGRHQHVLHLPVPAAAVVAQLGIPGASVPSSHVPAMSCLLLRQSRQVWADLAAAAVEQGQVGASGLLARWCSGMCCAARCVAPPECA